ncbi:50S ribosomal protein L25 [Candidatus Gracilibacteria bacterium]|nr:50S ribosomal protein L25 [Candidatus Gracilibacteria bacterium]
MKLNVEIRNITGKEVKKLRREGIIPAVIYGKHTDKSISISCEKIEFLKLFKKTGYSTPITLSGEGIDQLALIQEIQVDPVSDFLSHIDFLAVSRDEKVTASVPVLLIGESNIEKNGEGNIQLLKDSIEVEAFPQDLPHEIKIDISKIENMNDVVFVKDLDVGSKAEIVEDLEQPVITVVAISEEVEEEVVPETTGEEGDTKEENKKEGDAKEEDKKEGDNK